MKHIDKLAEDYAEVWPDDYGTAILSYQAGYLRAVEDAHKALIAWLECTGVIPKGTSYYAECLGCVTDLPEGGVDDCT